MAFNLSINLMLSKELDAIEFLTKEEEERKKREILKLENERLLKEKDQQDLLCKLNHKMSNFSQRFA